MPNSKDAVLSKVKRILNLGPTGSGKSAQLWTLPGRLFTYIFDPNTLPTVQGLDMEYEAFMPDLQEIDPGLKGFNKGAKDDSPKYAKTHEPTTYNRWADDLNNRAEAGYFKDFDWLCFDSLTYLSRALMNRQLFLNGRFGDIEELGDYRVVGSKLSSVFDSLVSLEMNMYMTGHIDQFENEKTKRIETLIRAPGSARAMLPLIFTDIWGATRDVDPRTGETRYFVRTQPDPRGLKDIRTTIRGMPELVDVTIPNFPSNRGGIGQLLATYIK